VAKDWHFLIILAIKAQKSFLCVQIYYLYYGERATEYLLGKKSIMPYRVAWVAAAYLGSVTSLALVWDLADAMNALMAIPNLVALLMLSNVLVADTKKYLWDEGGIDVESAEQVKQMD
jgi:AGCS family alanine or glycine:cation symporter